MAGAWSGSRSTPNRRSAVFQLRVGDTERYGTPRFDNYGYIGLKYFFVPQNPSVHPWPPLVYLDMVDLLITDQNKTK